MAGVGTVLRDSLMAFSSAFQTYPEAYPGLRGFAAADLDRKETASILPAGTSVKYRDFVAMTLEQQRAVMASEDGRTTVKALIDILDKVNDLPTLSAQILALLDGAITDEKGNLDHLTRAHKHPKAPVNLVTLFNRLLIPLEGVEGNVSVAAASHLLAAFLAETAVRGGSDDPTERIHELVSLLVQQAE